MDWEAPFFTQRMSLLQPALHLYQSQPKMTSSSEEHPRRGGARPKADPREDHLPKAALEGHLRLPAYPATPAVEALQVKVTNAIGSSSAQIAPMSLSHHLP